MSSDGVVLQHRTKLIAHLFVDRSYDLLTCSHIKKFSLDDRRLQLENNRNLLRPSVSVALTDNASSPVMQKASRAGNRLFFSSFNISRAIGRESKRHA
jgi:hypothetical protein